MENIYIYIERERELIWNGEESYKTEEVPKVLKENTK
jgi:hypothetical protein